MRFIKNGKVKNAYVFTEEELANMWILMAEGLEKKKADSDIMTSFYSPYEHSVYDLLVKNGYFDRLDERYNEIVAEMRK